MRTIKLYTLGCKVNQYDTQSIRERFLEKGYKEAPPEDKPDIFLINTCTVTSSADQKSRSLIKNCIKNNPKSKIIVTGCMVKKDSYALSKIKGVSFIISKSFFKEGITDFCAHTRAFLKIQDGCNNSCSYCKVPLVRGRSRSRPLADIVMEARVLSTKGFKEIVLTGICLGSYGKDLKGKINLIDVISSLEEIPGLMRIRLSSIEAHDVTDELIDKISKSKKLCPHLHIPIQSGDDKVLKLMRRRYSRKYYLTLITKIRKKLPRIAITTDCLVGFPGESERGFRNSLSLVKKIMPLRVHIFPYSPREGTYAAGKFTQTLNPKVVRERIERLKALADNCRIEYINKFQGKKMPVLFECLSKEKKGYWEGYSDNYIKVFVKSRKPLRNKILIGSIESKDYFGLDSRLQ
jgi:threonylcarbamoyladenosine tRNA methylthiotransferase MtaB